MADTDTPAAADKETLKIKLDPQLMQELQQEAEKSGKSAGRLARTFIQRGLKRAQSKGSGDEAASA